nr:TRAP transporter substrate-binding protein [Sedimentibacter sp.]
MYYWDYIYSRNDNCIISLDTSTERCDKVPKGYLDIKMFASDGAPIKNAYVRISTLNEFNNFMVKINALGYHPVQINNVQFYPGLLCKLKVNLNSMQSKYKVSNQIINLPTYENIQYIQNILEVPQNEVRSLSFSLGIDRPTDTLTYLYAEKFAEEVYTLSNGKIKIEIFPDAKLGADREMLRTILLDESPNFIIQTTASQIDFIPKLSVFDMPMVYTDIEDLRNTLDSKSFYEKISDAYSDSGYKLLGIADSLFRQMTSNKEIQNIEDFKGIKIRTRQNHNYEELWKLLGATVVPLPTGEIYPSLKFGYIDAEESPYETVVIFKLYEVQKYLINTYHLPNLLSLITSNALYNSFNAAEKDIISEAAVRAISYAREKADERLEELKNLLISNGMTIVDLPEETRQEMKSIVSPLYEKIREVVGDDDLIDLYCINNTSCHIDNSKSSKLHAEKTPVIQ